MVEKANITSEEFERRRQQPRSKWGELIEKLRQHPDNVIFQVALDDDEKNGPGRERARQSIYAIARYHKIRVKFLTDDGILLVAKSGVYEGDQ